MGKPLGPLGPKEKWIAALRGGEFTQYRKGWSSHPNGPKAFCCLGVAGAISGLGYAEYDDMRAALGMSERVMAGLIEMNDVAKLSFAQIADWVETHDLSTGELLSSSERSEAALTTNPA